MNYHLRDGVLPDKLSEKKYAVNSLLCSLFFTSLGVVDESQSLYRYIIVWKVTTESVFNIMQYVV